MFVHTRKQHLMKLNSTNKYEETKVKTKIHFISAIPYIERILNKKKKIFIASGLKKILLFIFVIPVHSILHIWLRASTYWYSKSINVNIYTSLSLICHLGELCSHLCFLGNIYPKCYTVFVKKKCIVAIIRFLGGTFRKIINFSIFFYFSLSWPTFWQLSWQFIFFSRVNWFRLILCPSSPSWHMNIMGTYIFS